MTEPNELPMDEKMTMSEVKILMSFLGMLVIMRELMTG